MAIESGPTIVREKLRQLDESNRDLEAVDAAIQAMDQGANVVLETTEHGGQVLNIPIYPAHARACLDYSRMQLRNRRDFLQNMIRAWADEAIQSGL